MRIGAPASRLSVILERITERDDALTCQRCGRSSLLIMSEGELAVVEAYR